MIFVSGAERPQPLRELGESSNMPEEFGVDFCWATPNGMVGFQRKAFPGDLLASLNDGRLGKELAQMKALTVAGIILEGEPMFTAWGDLMFSYGNMTDVQLVSLQYSLQVNHGLKLFWTKTPEHTAKVIQAIYAYSIKGEASSLLTRNKPKWGDIRSDSDFAVFLVESVPGVGHKRAKDIVRYYKGTLPIEWHGSVDDLTNVPGIGKKTAEAVVRAFGGTL